jgi:hypothetical protein
LIQSLRAPFNFWVPLLFKEETIPVLDLSHFLFLSPLGGIKRALSASQADLFLLPNRSVKVSFVLSTALGTYTLVL